MHENTVSICSHYQGVRLLSLQRLASEDEIPILEEKLAHLVEQRKNTKGTVAKSALAELDAEIQESKAILNRERRRIGKLTERENQLSHKFDEVEASLFKV